MKISIMVTKWPIYLSSVVFLIVSCSSPRDHVYAMRSVDHVARGGSQLTTYDLHLFDTIWPLPACPVTTCVDSSSGWGGLTATPIVRHTAVRAQSSASTADSLIQTRAAGSSIVPVSGYDSGSVRGPLYWGLCGLMLGCVLGAVILLIIVKVFR